jgi:hypothetical protein
VVIANVSRHCCVCRLTCVLACGVLCCCVLQASEPGTIRGDYCIEVGRNVIHGSDSVENANKEIALWFGGEYHGQHVLCSMCPAAGPVTGCLCACTARR